MRLDHVTIPVPAGKIDEVHAFYGAVLGIEALPVREQYRDIAAWYRVEDVELHFIGNENWQPPQEHALLAEAGPHVALLVDDVERIRHELYDHGVEPHDAEHHIPNRKRLFCRDPFGNLIECFEMVEE